MSSTEDTLAAATTPRKPRFDSSGLAEVESLNQPGWSLFIGSRSRHAGERAIPSGTAPGHRVMATRVFGQTSTRRIALMSLLCRAYPFGKGVSEESSVNLTGDTRFIRLYERYYHSILAYCRRRTAPDRAEDAAADTFLTAWRRIDDLPADDDVLPWLYGVAYRVLAHQWRSVSRRKRLRAKLESLGVDPGSEPGEVVVARWESRQVMDALKRLNDTDREILRLAAWEGLSYTEIAEALEIGVEAVRQRFYQARKNATREYNRLERSRRESPAAQKGGVW